MVGRRWRSDEGAALVEFAIAVPLLLFVVWCMVDFSRAYFTSNSLASAVREGGRFAASRKDFATADLDSVKSHVRTAFSPMGGDTLTNGLITITVPTTASDRVTVTVTDYQWKSTTPLTLFASGMIKMTRSSTFRWERDTSP